MKKISVLDKELYLGLCSKVSGNYLEITIDNDKNLDMIHLMGNAYNESLINSYILINSFDKVYIAQINSEEVPQNYRIKMNPMNINHNDNIRPTLKATFLAELDVLNNFNVMSDSNNYPAINSKVYIADKRVVERYLKNLDVNNINKNKLIDDVPTANNFASINYNQFTINFNMSFQSLFSRHLAIVGATGSGKSTTSGKLIYEVLEQKQRCIILDATGEYKKLVNNFTDDVYQIDFGEGDFLNISNVTKEDLTDIFSPSNKVQLPKLIDAINSLKILNFINDDKSRNNYKHFIENNQYIKKELKNRSKFQELNDYYLDNKKDDSFNLFSLPKQIENECYYPTKRYEPEKYGDIDSNTVGNCLPLISRIENYLDDDNFKRMFNLNKDSDEKFDIFTKINSLYNQGNNSKSLYINLNELPEEGNLRQIIVNIIGRKILKLSKEKYFQKYPVICFLDEAHRYLSSNEDNFTNTFSLDAFKTISKEGRKNGLFLSLITQSPMDIPSSILGQFGSFIVHRLSNRNERNYISSILPVNSYFESQLPSFSSGTAIISSAYLLSPVLIHVHQNENQYRITSSTPTFKNMKK